MIIKGQTSSGFEFEVDDRLMSDFRLIEIMADKSGDSAPEKVGQALSMARLLLGDKLESLKGHIASLNDGFIPAEAVFDDVNEIMKALQGESKTAKN